MKQPKILVVDNKKNLLAMRRLLEVFDAEIHTASSGQEVLEMIQEHDFALVLLDLQMPDTDSFKTAEMIRLADNTNRISIIFITSISQERQHVLKGYQSGAVDYIFKPVEAEILLSKVSVFLSLYERKLELEHMVHELEVSKQLIEKQNEVLTRLAIHDDLTGLYNRRHLNTVLKQEFNRCIRYGSNLALLILDLDHFKKVNDTHGHKFGDFVLETFARRILEVSRSTDHVFRFGGEEFIVLLTQTDINGGMVAGEKIRKKCQSELYTKDNVSQQVTTCIGVSSFQNSNEEPNDMIAKADKALYIAKREGRNKVVLCE